MTSMTMVLMAITAPPEHLGTLVLYDNGFQTVSLDDGRVMDNPWPALKSVAWDRSESPAGGISTDPTGRYIIGIAPRGTHLTYYNDRTKRTREIKLPGESFHWVNWGRTDAVVCSASSRGHFQLWSHANDTLTLQSQIEIPSSAWNRHYREGSLYLFADHRTAGLTYGDTTCLLDQNTGVLDCSQQVLGRLTGGQDIFAWRNPEGVFYRIVFSPHYSRMCRDQRANTSLRVMVSRRSLRIGRATHRQAFWDGGRVGAD